MVGWALLDENGHANARSRQEVSGPVEPSICEYVKYRSSAVHAVHRVR
jgi:hypothetical protein